MHVARLHAAIKIALGEIEDYGIMNRMQRFHKIFHDSMMGARIPPEKLDEDYRDFSKILKECPTNNASPLQRRIFKQIGINRLIGVELWEQIEPIVSRRGIPIPVALDRFNDLLKQFKDVYSRLFELNKAFSFFNIELDHLGPDEAEIGLAIPAEITKSNLEGLEEEIHDWNRVFNTFNEFAGEHVESLKIRSVSSSGVELFLATTIAVAALLATTIERIVALYKNLLEIKKLKAELAKHNLPKECTQPIEKHEKELVDKELKSLTQMLIKNYKGNEGRKNELKTALNKDLRLLADRIGKGVLIEVKAAEPTKPRRGKRSKKGEEGSSKRIQAYNQQKALVDSINAKGRSMAQLKQPTKPVALLASENHKDKHEK